jgi:S-adenosylmethionine hydrolase
MNIITLTTDLGLKDHYVASLKGYIYKHCSKAQLVDVSHVVKAFDIANAAFFVGNILEDFPENTVHLIAVNAAPRIDFDYPERSEFPCVMQYKNQYFVAIDNGLFSLILGEDKPQAIYRMEEMLSSPDALLYPSKNMLAKIACKLANGELPQHFGKPQDGVKKALAVAAVSEENLIKGAIIHVDNYGNLISNVSEELFRKVGKGAPFIIYFRRKEYFIDQISTTYNDVHRGEKVAFFNASGRLEIAINHGAASNNGGADALLGMQQGDVVRIEFQPKGSVNSIDKLFR